MPTLVPQTISRSGLVAVSPGYTTDTGDAGPDDFPNSGRTVFALDAATGSVTVTVAVQAGQCSDNDLSIGLLITESLFLGPFPVATYGADVTVGGVTGEEIAALELAL